MIIFRLLKSWYFNPKSIAEVVWPLKIGQSIKMLIIAVLTLSKPQGSTLLQHLIDKSSSGWDEQTMDSNTGQIIRWIERVATNSILRALLPNDVNTNKEETFKMKP
jgi:hypothetical protein